MTVWQANGVSRPDATTNMASTFRELLTTLEDGGYMYPPDIEYDVCCKCYDVYRGPEEVQQRATHCRHCGHTRTGCLKFVYRSVALGSDGWGSVLCFLGYSRADYCMHICQPDTLILCCMLAPYALK